MPIPVPIDAVADELESLPDEALTYLNRKTGEFLTVPVADIGAVEEGAEDVESFDWPWTQEDLPKLRDIAAGEDWVALPDKFEIHEWSIMERFSRETPEPMSSRLSKAIHGRGAFRRFYDLLHEHGLADDWYKFKHEQIVSLVQEALTDESIPFARGRV
jgi:hypothetical protein